MTVNAKAINDSTIEVTFGGKTETFPAYKNNDGSLVAPYVFASPIVRNGKDWPVSVLVRSDGSTSVYYPSGLTLNRGTVRINGFWKDSKNQSKHNKVH